MNKRTIYISTASWEPRFLEGARRIIGEGGCSVALCFWFEEYDIRTSENRKAFESEFTHLNPRMEPLRLIPHVQPATQRPIDKSENALWNRIFKIISEHVSDVDSFVFDITTTPRETLWIVLDLLTELKLNGTLVYHRAARHGEWCGGEPCSPHIVPKLGGISHLDQPTKLLVLTGFDEARSEQFITHYEPTETVILLQKGSVEEDPERNQKPHRDRFENRHGCFMEELNSFSPDWGYEALKQASGRIVSGANLILASVGPKTSACALYRLHRTIENSALVYAPCRDYNLDYSEGIGETLRLFWDSEMIGNVPAERQ